MPEVRSPAAKTVRVALLALPVFTLAVTFTGFSLAGMDDVVSGSVLGKLIALVLKLNFAVAETVALMVRVWVLVAAQTAPASRKVQIISKDDNFMNFHYAVSLLSCLGFINKDIFNIFFAAQTAGYISLSSSPLSISELIGQTNH